MLLFYLLLIETPGAKKRFEEIHNQNKDIMYYTAYKILRHREDAEDAVHQTFLKIIEIWKNIEQQACPQISSLCAVICRNTAIDIARKNKYRTHVQLEDLEYGETAGSRTEEEVFSKMDMERLISHISELPEIYRDTFLLIIGNDLSIPQVAKALNKSKETIKKRLQRGRSLLLVRMKEEISYA